MTNLLPVSSAILLANGDGRDIPAHKGPSNYYLGEGLGSTFARNKAPDQVCHLSS
ncbi:MAG TPA: hypothetical protein VKB62_11380 [Streptosporangiaceae bacterium]|nr:hypothetical protein [Streptosporangiaceae bacterium]